MHQWILLKDTICFAPYYELLFMAMGFVCLCLLLCKSCIVLWFFLYPFISNRERLGFCWSNSISPQPVRYVGIYTPFLVHYEIQIILVWSYLLLCCSMLIFFFYVVYMYMYMFAHPVIFCMCICS